MGTGSKPNSFSRTSVFIWVALPLAVTLTLFQNCGPAYHTYSDPSQMGAAKTPTPTNSLVLQDPAAQNTAFRVQLTGDEIVDGTQYFWSGDYTNGTPCAQTQSADGVTATFTCAQAGAVVIQLAATDPQGQINLYSLSIMVANGPGATQPPAPSPTPSPTPTPTPAPLDGAALYTTNCSGCHGPLATSQRRGISRAQLDLAIVQVGAMAALSSLSAAERNAIVQALQ